MHGECSLDDVLPLLPSDDDSLLELSGLSTWEGLLGPGKARWSGARL